MPNTLHYQLMAVIDSIRKEKDDDDDNDGCGSENNNDGNHNNSSSNKDAFEDKRLCTR